jgi:hypothetical protein
MRAAPAAVLAVDDPGLGRVQPQPASSILFCSAASTSRACRKVAQGTTASSAYRSDWASG